MQATKSDVTTITIEHVSKSSAKPIDEAIATFESNVGRGDMQRIIGAVADGTEVSVVASMQAENELMILGVVDVGNAIPCLQRRGNRSKQYLVGNPLIANKMIPHHLEVCLYIPLRVFIGETDEGTIFVYDKPSSLLGQWDDERILEVAKQLDAKLEQLSEITLK